MYIQKNISNFQTAFELYKKGNDIKLFDKAANEIVKKDLNDIAFVLNSLRTDLLNSNFTNTISLAGLIRIGSLCEINIEIFETLLKIANIVTQENIALEKPEHFWIVEQLYDIIFHQIDFKTENKESKKLYIELTLELLSDKYHPLTGIQGSFDQSIYFIMLSDHIFADSEDTFNAIWQQIQFHLDTYGRTHHLSQNWINTFNKLND